MSEEQPELPVVKGIRGFLPGNRKPNGGEKARDSFAARIPAARARDTEYRALAARAANLPVVKQQLAQGQSEWIRVECHGSQGFHASGARVRLILGKEGINVDLEGVTEPAFAVTAASTVLTFVCSDCGRRHSLRAVELLERAVRALVTPTRVGRDYITRMQ